ncbi:VOC family protein [Acidicapsa dinghuensis]|uniref:VOC family protein n=1 Tax=Acidicapsa dinghuensis TaxID=2218256 RepID=A0ABW1EG44_9BACT|nr:VOC family protein [Acidicapsa dinghuensis]
MTTLMTEPVKTRRANNMVWFELPVTNLERATEFYEIAFGTDLKTDARFPRIAMFPRTSDEAVTGALAEMSSVSPSTDGTVVYLNCDGDIDGVLKRAKAAGGEVLQEVAQLPGGMGWIAQFRDLDGNRVGLHATF